MTDQLDLFKDERARSPTDSEIEKKGKNLNKGGLSASQLALAKNLKEKSYRLKFNHQFKPSENNDLPR